MIINNKIKEQVCHNAIDLLDDKNMIDIYKNSKSVVKNIEILSKILHNNKVDNEKISTLLMILY